ncbi:hypothetical protein QE429_004324 [Bacillus sp. SORGH_AS 510]|uniref:hypothetical protein n=1 Tax=Bacillus sp. SORGH_AS_0510 TaxID=3041771 RepID=UPI00277DCEDC|nr:hypothetical protein [Bacillus sp. SORGH_AS_0510]MDQ1147497.1 hypothetical protein [Bacillus sp. SORGH_AS_0510]
MRLEYRLDDKHRQYPALWNYLHISTAEAVARMSCEFFVKEGETYEVTATATDPDGTLVLYVQKEQFPKDSMEAIYSHIGLEIREIALAGTSLIEKREIWEHEEVLTILHSDVIYVERNGKFMEFALDSREIDEDRKCYVYYGKFTGDHR